MITRIGQLKQVLEKYDDDDFIFVGKSMDGIQNIIINEDYVNIIEVPLTKNHIDYIEDYESRHKNDKA